MFKKSKKSNKADKVGSAIAGAIAAVAPKHRKKNGLRRKALRVGAIGLIGTGVATIAGAFVKPKDHE